MPTPLRFPKQLPYAVFVFGVTLVLTTTLFPYDFLSRDAVTKFEYDLLSASAWTPAKLSDVLENILLYVPLGFGICGMFCVGNGRKTSSLAKALIAILALSAGIEALQMHMPSRNPSLADILANGLGAGSGCLICNKWSTPIYRRIGSFFTAVAKRLSLNKLAAAYVSYLAMAAALSVLLSYGSKLDGWDDSYSLMIGNERTGDRPWRGSVSNLMFADCVINPEVISVAWERLQTDSSINDQSYNVIAAFMLSHERGLSDLTGNLPALVWQGGSPGPKLGSQVQITSQNWIQSDGPATYLSQSIRRTSQFTMSVRVKTDDTAQYGPARIVSLSSDPLNRNFTLAQESTNLVFRLRTPLTGANGSNPHLTIPHVFNDRLQHHIIIRYNGETVDVLVDGNRQATTLTFSPGMAAWGLLSQVTAEDSRGYEFLYYGTVYLPLGFLLALALGALRRRWISLAGLTLLGLLLPNLILAAVRTATDAGVDIQGIAWGLIAVATSTCVTLSIIRPWQRN